MKSISEFRQSVMRECFCIFLCMLQFTDGCHVSDYKQLKKVTGYTGGSVLLPCSCNNPQSTVKKFTWLYYRENRWTKVFKNSKYKDRLTLFDQSAPANLSLLISDLRKKDEGDYRCQTSQTYTDFQVKIKGCDLDQNTPAADVTGHSGESVDLPCFCTELQAKPKHLTWTFTSLHKTNSEEIYPHVQSERHTGRVKLLNEISPGNLSLKISNLNKEDQGEYRCSVSSRHINIRLTVQESHIHTLHTTNEPIKQTEEPTTKQSEKLEKQLSILSFPTVYILLSVLPVVLLLAVLALIYLKCRGRRDVQETINDGLVLMCSENEKQGDVNPESVTQGKNLTQDENVDEVTYSSVVYIKTDSKPAHIQTVMTEHSEYASIK